MRVLAVGAHPDDLELLAGGTLARYSAEGHEVVMCHISNGDKGHTEIPSEELVKIRDEEARRAASVINATSLCLNYTDCGVFHNDESVRKMAGLIRQARPDLIITHAPNDYMPDHRETSRIVFDASFHATLPYYKASGEVFKKVVPLYYMDTVAGVEFLPTHYVDVTDFWPKKRQMISCHQSQLKWLAEHDKIDFVEFVETYTRFRGLQCGVKYAEGFRQEMDWGRIRPGPLME